MGVGRFALRAWSSTLYAVYFCNQRLAFGCAPSGQRSRGALSALVAPWCRGVDMTLCASCFRTGRSASWYTHARWSSRGRCGALWHFGMTLCAKYFRPRYTYVWLRRRWALCASRLDVAVLCCALVHSASCFWLHACPFELARYYVGAFCALRFEIDALVKWLCTPCLSRETLVFYAVHLCTRRLFCLRACLFELTRCAVTAFSALSFCN